MDKLSENKVAEFIQKEHFILEQDTTYSAAQPYIIW